MKRIWIPSILIVLAFIPLLSPPVWSQNQTEELTLSQAVALALEQNSQVLQARESIAGSTAKMNESRSAEYPLVNVSASYARVGPVASYTVAIGPMFPPITMKFGVENTYSTGVNIQHSLFNWGRTQAGVDISEAGLRLTESSLDLARQNVAYQVIQTFYGILVSREAVGVLTQSISSLESRLKTIRSRYDAGLASNFDVLTIEVQIATVRSRKVDTDSNLRRLELLFNRFTGRPISSPVSLKGELRYQSTATRTSGLVQAATENRRELEQLKHQEALAFAQMRLTNSLDKPNVNLSLTWGLRNGYMPNLDVLRGNWNAGVMLTYPLFDGFKTRNQLDQAEVNIHLAQMRYEDVKSSVSMEVHQSLVDLRANEEKIAIEEMKVKQSEEALKIADERHARGLMSTLDLLDSQTSLENARLSLLQATFNAIISKYNLDKAIGIKP